jgi:hypothetical protein
MLPEEIASAQRSVKTDAYQMSIGEIVSMYDNSEIVIDPEFQRFFRWEIGQKSKLIESLLLLLQRTAAGFSARPSSVRLWPLSTVRW